MLTRCKCGSSPVRMNKRTRAGIRWWVECPICHVKTKRYRANGGELFAWNEGKVS